jgi:hypothetical protein
MNIKEFLIAQPSLEQVLGAYPSKKPPNCTIRDYDFALMSMMQLEQNRDIAELKCLLQPCSFGQAVVMMEKGAVMQEKDGDLFFKISNDRMLEGHWYSEDTIKWQDLFEFGAFDISDYFKSLFCYTPWVVGSNEQGVSVINYEFKGFCDEILRGEE